MTLVEGDAHRSISKLQGPVDVVFIDAEKDGYVDYLNQVLPLIRPGGLILAHNVDMVPDYVKAVSANPAHRARCAGFRLFHRCSGRQRRRAG